MRNRPKGKEHSFLQYNTFYIQTNDNDLLFKYSKYIVLHIYVDQNGMCTDNNKTDPLAKQIFFW